MDRCRPSSTHGALLFKGARQVLKWSIRLHGCATLQRLRPDGSVLPCLIIGCSLSTPLHARPLVVVACRAAGVAPAAWLAPLLHRPLKATL